MPVHVLSAWLLGAWPAAKLGGGGLYAVHNKEAEESADHTRESMITSVLLAKIRAYLKYRETVRQLSRLSDRELDDIGIDRADILRLARLGSAG